MEMQDNQHNRQTQIKQLCERLAELLIAKNTDYGDSAFKAPPLVPCLSPAAAILVRIGDKIERLENLAKKAGELAFCVDSETVEDTVADLAGYCILYLIAMQEAQDAKTEVDEE